VENIVSSGKKVADDVQVIATGIRSGHGAVGRLFNDEKLADSVARSRPLATPMRSLNNSLVSFQNSEIEKSWKKWNRPRKMFGN
jgi:hypothetical protein